MAWVSDFMRITVLRCSLVVKIVCGNDCLWTRSSVVTIVCGHDCLWSRLLVVMIIAVTIVLWTRSFVVTIVCGHDCLWSWFSDHFCPSNFSIDMTRLGPWTEPESTPTNRPLVSLCCMVRGFQPEVSFLPIFYSDGAKLSRTDDEAWINRSLKVGRSSRLIG